MSAIRNQERLEKGGRFIMAQQMPETKEEVVGKKAWVLPALLITLTLLVISIELEARSYTKDIASFLGGSAWDRVQGIYVDAAGFIYVIGTTKSADFPTTPGVFDRTHNGPKNDSDGYVAKLSPDATQLIWSTYLGGNRRDDVYGVRADAAGNVYVIGGTRSRNFPTTEGAYDRTLSDGDAFVVKLNSNASALIYSTYAPGAARGGMHVDAFGRVFYSGIAVSTNNYTVTSGAIQSTFQGGAEDGFVGMLSADGSSLLYASYLGSSGDDNAFGGIYAHSDGSILVAGLAGAADFPTTPGAFQTAFGGQGSGSYRGDAFVTRFSLDGTLHYSTFVGGSGDETPMAQNAFTVDVNGNAIVYCNTTSTDYPVTAGAFQSSLNGSINLAISKISLDGSTLLASTYLGGSGRHFYEPSGIQVDKAGTVYLSGTLYNALNTHPVTPDAWQPNAGGGNEAFLSVLSADFSTLIYSTYAGRSGNERGRSLWMTPNGGVVFGGDTTSANYPVSPGAFQQTYAGGANGDGYILSFKPVGAHLAR